MARGRGDRFRAYVDNECVYWTDSIKGMRDQCVRLLEWKWKDATIVVSDSANNSFVKNVTSLTIEDWRI